MISDKAYGIIKWIAQVVLPALATLYSALGAVWGWSYIQEVVVTITSVDTFLGILLGITTSSYNKTTATGDMIVNPESIRLALDATPEDLAKKASVTFKVKKDS